MTTEEIKEACDEAIKGIRSSFPEFPKGKQFPRELLYSLIAGTIDSDDEMTEEEFEPIWINAVVYVKKAYKGQMHEDY